MASESFFCPHCGSAYVPDEKQCPFCQHVFADEPDLSDQSTLFHERYQLLNQIGTGGFGAVYRARDTQEQQRMVAIKQINLRGLTPQEIIEATDGFNRERQFLSSLAHDHLPRIYDHFMDAEHWYLIMEFIEGQTLETYLQSMSSASASFVRSLTVDEIVDIGLQLCDVLGYLHSQRQPIIFRDLKPSNVMRTDLGAIYLIDFGIARYFKPGKPKDTIPFGSPGYAAPEQYGKGQTTAQADIYSLGALLYYMLSGLDPAENPFHFAPLRLYGTAGLTELEELIMQMVALDAQDRPRDIQVVTIELQHIRRLRGNTEPRIWRPPTAVNPQSTGSVSYWPGSPSQSGQGQQQAQMQPPQAQPQQAAAQGIGRRTLLQNGWRIGLAIGVGGLILHNVFPSSPSSDHRVDPGPEHDFEAQGPVLRSLLETQLLANGVASNITSVALSSQKGLLAAADQVGNIFVLSTMTYKKVYQLQVPQSVTSLSWSFGDQYLSVAAGRSIYTWEIPDLTDGEIVGALSKNPWATYKDILPDTVQTVSWYPTDNRTLAVGDSAGNVRVFQISETGVLSNPLYTLTARSGRSQPPDGPPTATINWVGSRLYALSDHDSVKIWDLDNQSNKDTSITFPDLAERVQEIVCFPDSTSELIAAILTVDGQVYFMDTNYQALQRSPNIGGINALAYSAANDCIFAVANDGIYTLPLRTLTSNPVNFAQRDPMHVIDYRAGDDGMYIVTGGPNGAIQIWAVE